jgi:hypothetical protein
MASAYKAITQTLTAATATNDTLTGPWSVIEVVNHTTHTNNHVVYVSIGSAVPTVAGNDFIPVLPQQRVRLGAQPGNAGTTVRLISSANPTVTIIGLSE